MPLTLALSGEGCRPFLAPWSDQGRARRPDQEAAACNQVRTIAAALPTSIALQRPFVMLIVALLLRCRPELVDFVIWGCWGREEERSRRR